MSIKFIVITCEKYHNTRVESIRKTWGKNKDIIFLSDINLGDDIIGYEYLPKGYENIHYKYSEFFKKNNDFSKEWYFFTDDDTFVNYNNVVKLLKTFKSEDSLCIGHYGRLNKDGKDMDGHQTGFPIHTIKGEKTYLPIDYPSGGAGFILSKKSLRLIHDYLHNLDDEKIPKCYNGDVTVGFWLRNCNINKIDIEGFWWTNPKTLKHNDDLVKKCYTYHYIDEIKMKELFYL